MSEDEKLVKQLKKGDKEAMKFFYGKYSRLVYYYIYKFIPSKEDCEELLQDTFLTVFKKINTLKNPEAIRSWLATIAMNKCKDWSMPLKAEKRTAEIVDEDITNLNDMDAGAEFLPDYILERKELKDYVVDMVSKLPYLQKVAIMDFYFQELSLQEISNKEECSVASIKNALYKGKKTLKNQLEGLQEEVGRDSDSISVRGMVALPLLTQIFREDLSQMDVGAILDNAWDGIKGSLGGISTVLGIKSVLVSAKLLIPIGVLAVVIPVVGITMNSLDSSAPELFFNEKKATEEEIPENLHEEPIVSEVIDAPPFTEITEGTVQEVLRIIFPVLNWQPIIEKNLSQDETNLFSSEDWELLEWLKNNGTINDRDQLLELLERYGFSKDVMVKLKKGEKLNLYSYATKDFQIVIAEKYDPGNGIWILNYEVYDEVVPLDEEVLFNLLGMN